jgi:hypothetical protein
MSEVIAAAPLAVERRTMFMSSHGGLHHPDCKQLDRLTVPPVKVELGPDDEVRLKDGGWGFFAWCCWKKFDTELKRINVWRYPDE